MHSRISDFEQREHDDDEEIPMWPGGSECLPTISWPSFVQSYLHFWQVQNKDV